MNRLRYALAATAAILIAVAWIGLLSVRSGIVQTRVDFDGVPAVVMRPTVTENAPAVLVGHGFAGSKNLMLGYGYTLAQAGYVVILWDFAGHGDNANRIDDVPVQADVDTIYAALAAMPNVDLTRVGILGHSRGSGAAMAAGVRDPDRFGAVVAVSPVNAAVTPQLPRNLMFQAGSLEAPFVANAERLLVDAGGHNADLSQGLGRTFQLIPNAEHISILFRPLSQQLALAWFDASFGHVAQRIVTDVRVIWYALHLLAWLLMLAATAPLWPQSDERAALRPRSHVRWGGLRAVIGLIVSPLAGIGVVWLVEQATPAAQIGGILVAGAVAIWLAAAGIVWRATNGYAFSLKTKHPLGDVATAAALFVVLSLAFGVMSPHVWLPWWMIPQRLAVWPLLVVGVFPWFWVVGQVQEHGGVALRVLWWIAKSAVMVTAMIVLISVAPGMGILSLMAPLLPILFAILDFANAQVRRPLGYALGSALFFGWVLAVVFPLAG
ncbi:MAG: alpha/beta fold hydrolase [Caldilineaceae bacterium]|nr:alpha/beta fold hydrolase [Caldilineaceae bacterium]